MVAGNKDISIIASIEYACDYAKFVSVCVIFNILNVKNYTDAFIRFDSRVVKFFIYFQAIASSYQRGLVTHPRPKFSASRKGEG